MAGTMIDPGIFAYLKAKMEEDIKTGDELKEITQSLERSVSYAQGVLSRVHSTPRSNCEAH